MDSKWAIIGSNGFIAPRHKEAIKAIGGNLLLTCDIQGEANFKDWEEMLRSEQWKDITHVAICTPNDLHCEMARACLSTGKVVLCEKPLALNTKDLEQFKETDPIYTVLQLRYHKDIVIAKSVLNSGVDKAKLVVTVKRDKNYWGSWKGDEQRSGGILFNLGVHYFDLLIHLFGDRYKIISSGLSKKRAEGRIDFDGVKVDYYLEIRADDIGQDRRLEIGNKLISFSNKDNLSFEGLHTDLYRNLLLGAGIGIKEAAKSIKLCEDLKNYAG